jgi:hypothetical protein
VRADPTRYEELGRAEVFPGETCWTAPALHRGRLYLRSPTRAACLFVGKPERMTDRQRALAALPAVVPKAAAGRITWLVGAERDYPFELPDVRELTKWYVASLAALVAAALLAAVAYGMAQLLADRGAREMAIVAFFAALIVFGVVATPLANRYGSPFVFTWPLALIGVHQVALDAVTWSRRPECRKPADWTAVAGAGLLVLTCLIYFKLTRQLSLAPAWYFLLALPAAWPLAVPASRRLGLPHRLAGHVLWMLAIFSVYFWVAGGVMLFRTAALVRAGG